jgi:hypothetical protein
MQTTYWSDWKNLLNQWGLKTLACAMLDHTRPLLPIAAQMMILGSPLFKSASLAVRYNALIELLGDEDCILQFADYLHEDMI